MSRVALRIGSEKAFLALVGPELAERSFEYGIFNAGDLHLDLGQRPLDAEKHRFRATTVVMLGLRELVHL